MVFWGSGSDMQRPKHRNNRNNSLSKALCYKNSGSRWCRRHQLAWQASGDRWHGRLCGRECAAQKNDELSEIPDSFDALNYRSWLLNSGCWPFLLQLKLLFPVNASPTALPCPCSKICKRSQKSDKVGSCLFLTYIQ